jgi:arylamine N-acetyltransferase
VLDDGLAAAYLERLGVDARPGEVDAPMLAALQQAHVAAVPYENLDIVRGSPPGIDPYDCVRRVLGGRGGYCYHLNGSFATLLEWLGVDLIRHLSGVQGRGAVAPGPNGNHLGLTARVDGSLWLVDAGLGDGPVEPLPLAPGTYEQEGFVFGVEPSPFAPDGWRLRHDPRGAFELVDFSAAPASTPDFLEKHAFLSTSPESHFVQVAVVQRHTRKGVDILRGCVFTERTGAGDTAREIDSADDWWSLVIDGFGLAYGDLTSAERDALWRHVHATHEEWKAANEPV